LGGSPEGLDILQEGNLKGTGASYPHVLKDESVGNKIGLSEHRALAGSVMGALNLLTRLAII